MRSSRHWAHTLFRYGTSFRQRRHEQGLPTGEGEAGQLVFQSRAGAVDPEKGVGAMASMPAASNTEATQVRVLAKINTPVTRTRRHSPAHGGTSARIST